MKPVVFFDVDDTLYDHLQPFYQAVQPYTADKESFPYEEAYHRLRYHSDKLSLALGGAGKMGVSEATEQMRCQRFQLTLEEFGIRLSDSEAAAMQARYLGCQYDIDLFAGARDLIERLQAAGIRVGLITNGEGGHQRKKIAALQLDGLIPAHLQFISGEVGWDKPEQQLFAAVNERTGTKPEACVYIGDSWRNDVIGAIGAGWTAIWFNHRHVTPESDHAPDHIVSSYDQLSNLLFAPALPR